MYCEKCGAQIDAQSNFCDVCGAAVEASASPAVGNKANVSIAGVNKRRLISAALVFLTLLLTLFAWYNSGHKYNYAEELIDDISDILGYMDDEAEAELGFMKKIASGKISGIKLATMAPSIVKLAGDPSREVCVFAWIYTFLFWSALIMGIINILLYLTNKRCRTSVWFFVLLALAFLLSLAIVLLDLSNYTADFQLTFWPFLALMLSFAAIFVGRERKEKKQK